MVTPVAAPNASNLIAIPSVYPWALDVRVSVAELAVRNPVICVSNWSVQRISLDATFVIVSPNRTPSQNTRTLLGIHSVVHTCQSLISADVVQMSCPPLDVPSP